MPQLDKKLSLFGLTMIAVGSCIGSGIFLTPSEIVGVLQSPTLVIVVWLLGGLVALTGALTFAELSAIFPKTGGVYVYLKEAYGDFAGFAYGWVILLVINSGAIAALSIAFTTYLGHFVQLSSTEITIIAAIGIAVITVINIFSVSISQYFAGFFTVAKLLGIGAIIVAGFFFIDFDIYTMELPAKFEKGSLSSAFAVAFIGVLWSTGGWHHASFVSGEAKNAQRNVPLAMVFGVLIVTAVYVLCNFSYMALLPVNEIAGSKKLAADAIASIWVYGAGAVSILIIVSTFGTVGIYTISAPRIYQAMAQDGLFFKFLAKIHPKYHTPVNAMLLQAAWAICLLVFWGTFSNLISYVVFTDFLFMLMAAVGIFLFRRKKLHLNIKYRTLAYPVTPLIFIGIIGWFLITILAERPVQALAGLTVITLAVPVFLYFKQKK